MGLRTFLKLKKNKELPKSKYVKVGSYSLLANYEHPIEDYLAQFKYYSRNLPRIAQYLEVKYPKYTIIDVGANIGDSIALLRTQGVDQIIHAVEGDPLYIEMLTQNIHLFDNVEVHQTFLGEEATMKQVVIDNAKGTANIHVGGGDVDAGTGHVAQVVRLDDLIVQRGIECVKLLKTDTDGFDFKILRGSMDAIKRDKPILFFEYDADYLAKTNDDGLSIYEDFKRLGYNIALYYDNFGKFLLSTEISNTELLTQLYAYITKKEDCAFPYYDVCLFHMDDNELARECIRKEMEFYK